VTYRSLLLITLGLAQPTSAQELELRPISEHIALLDQDSIGVFRYAVRRCAGLYLLASEASEARSPDLGTTYFEAATQFLGLAIRADEALGSTAEHAQEATVVAVSDISELYRVRFRRNMAVSGSYFVDDPLVRADFEMCRSLADPSP
jgi:hypothetical protein